MDGRRGLTSQEVVLRLKEGCGDSQHSGRMRVRGDMVDCIHGIVVGGLRMLGGRGLWLMNCGVGRARLVQGNVFCFF